MWTKIKDAFAYGLGGSLGWQAGGFIGRVIGRLLKWIFVALFGWHFLGGLVDYEPEPHRKQATTHKEIVRQPQLPLQNVSPAGHQ